MNLFVLILKGSIKSHFFVKFWSLLCFYKNMGSVYVGQSMNLYKRYPQHAQSSPLRWKQMPTYFIVISWNVCIGKTIQKSDLPDNFCQKDIPILSDAVL
jgi:hypothetical protein